MERFFASVLVAISATIISCQWMATILLGLRRLGRERDTRAFPIWPLVGGLIGACGCLMAPSRVVQEFWWLPVLLDPGFAMLVSAVLCGVVQQMFLRRA